MLLNTRSTQSMVGACSLMQWGLDDQILEMDAWSFLGRPCHYHNVGQPNVPYDGCSHFTHFHNPALPTVQIDS